MLTFYSATSSGEESGLSESISSAAASTTGNSFLSQTYKTSGNSYKVAFWHSFWPSQESVKARAFIFRRVTGILPTLDSSEPFCQTLSSDPSSTAPAWTW